jgi:hypothetical protein
MGDSLFCAIIAGNWGGATGEGLHVIASEAKQSIVMLAEKWIDSSLALLAMTAEDKSKVGTR